MLGQFVNEPYHLCLLLECIGNAVYRDTYRDIVERGHHVILDNSAHELGHSRDVSQLIEVAKEIRPTEVVLPDRLFFGDDTAKLSGEAAELIRYKLPGIGMMAVPQGRTIEEWKNCLANLLYIEGLTCIGISKDYEVWPGGLRYLVSLVPSHMSIHLLGLGRHPMGLLGVGRDFSNVRGIDSAKPFVYAQAGIKLDGSLLTPQYPGRSHDYFESQIDSELVHYNWTQFKRMVSNYVALDSTLVETPVGIQTPIPV